MHDYMCCSEDNCYHVVKQGVNEIFSSKYARVICAASSVITIKSKLYIMTI